MALPVIADIFRCVFRWTQGAGGANPINVMHIAGVTSTASDVYDSIDVSVTRDMWQWVPGSEAVFAIDITPLDGSSATQTFPTGSGTKWQGEAGGDSIPQGAGLIKWTTAKRGRSYRGRTYLPMVAESQQAGGTMQNVSTVQTAWEAFRVSMATETNPVVVASYKLSTAEIVTAVLAETSLATQRRRLKR